MVRRELTSPPLFTCICATVPLSLGILCLLAGYRLSRKGFQFGKVGSSDHWVRTLAFELSALSSYTGLLL